MQESFSALAQRAQPQIRAQARPFTTRGTGYCLFLSMSDGSARGHREGFRSKHRSLLVDAG